MIYIPDIPLVDFAAQQAARDKLQSADVPEQLGALAVRIAAIRGELGVELNHKHIVLIGADAGHAQANPAETKTQMQAILDGTAEINRLATQHQAPLTLADVGMTLPITDPSIQSLRVAQCANMATGPALVITEVNDAFMVGMNIGSLEISRGMNLMAAGAVTSVGGVLPAIAVAAVLGQTAVAEIMPQEDPFDCGLSIAAQIELIEHAISINTPEKIDVIDVIRCVGSAEIATLAGLMLVAAAGRVPVIIDGLISAAAAYTAASLNPAMRFCLVAGKRPIHPAHTFILQKLGLRPLVDLNTTSQAAEGAASAFDLVNQATDLLLN